jgi:hypothetical protein
VLSGEIFKNCIEQNFEEIKLDILDDSKEDPTENPKDHIVRVRDNERFIDGELLACMKLMIESSLAIIGTNAENNEKQNLMGALGLYVLYRTLLPRKQQPDMKLHRKTFVTSHVLLLSFFFLSL